MYKLMIKDKSTIEDFQNYFNVKYKKLLMKKRSRSFAEKVLFLLSQKNILKMPNMNKKI